MAQLMVLYHIKKETRQGQEKTYFNRVGRGFVNKDGSYNIWLENLPTGLTEETTFNLQPYKPKEDRGERKGFADKAAPGDDDIPF